MSGRPGTHTLGDFLMGCVLFVMLCGLLLTVAACQACEDLAATGPDTAGGGDQLDVPALASTSTQTTAAGGTSSSEEPSPSGDSGTPEAGATTGSSVVLGGPTVTMAPMGAVWTRFEEDDPHLQWTGTWATEGPNPLLSGEYFRFGISGARVTVSFEGTRIRLIAARLPDSCDALVTLDGDEYFTVDLYNATTLSQVVVWTSPPLVSGRHQVEYAWTDDRHPDAIRPLINLDAVEVVGTLVY